MRLYFWLMIKIKFHYAVNIAYWLHKKFKVLQVVINRIFSAQYYVMNSDMFEKYIK